MLNILIINGPNLGLLGKREPEIYGNLSIDNINQELQKLKPNDVNLEFFQSDIEGEIVQKIGEAWTKDNINGIIINPGGYTHTSIAIHDAIKGSNLPVVETHISNIYQREEFRHKSVISSACVGQICGFGKNSYALALQGLLTILK